MKIESALRDFKICLIGNGDATAQLIKNSCVPFSEIVYADAPSQILVSICEENNLNLLKFSELEAKNYDLIVMYECPILIKEEQLKESRWLNIHFGILPTWRGHSANSWALLNDAEELGWTIHIATNDFDAGPILRVGTTQNDFKSPYYALKQTLTEQLENDLAQILYEYLKKDVKFQENSGQFNYCSKIQKKDGIISTFNLKSRYVYNLSRLFINANHSDLEYECCNKLYKIKSIDMVESSYIGPEGRVVKKDGNRVLMKTADGALWVEFANCNVYLNHYREAHK